MGLGQHIGGGEWDKSRCRRRAGDEGGTGRRGTRTLDRRNRWRRGLSERGTVDRRTFLEQRAIEAGVGDKREWGCGDSTEG